MAYISFKPQDYFNTKLYTGNGSAGNAQTGVGFAPDMVWIKSRSNAQKQCLFDTARGVQKVVYPSENSAEVTDAALVTAFGSDGYTVGADSDINGSGWTYVNRNWKMGTTTGISGGSLTPSAYSINTTAKQGIYAYTGTGATATIAHGLGATPTAIFIKTLALENWAVYSKGMGNTKYTILNTWGAIQTATTFWNDTSPTSTVFTIKDNVSVNTSGQTYIAYVFCDTSGYFKQGSYTGNGNADGTFVYTGFAPAYLFLKNDADNENWHSYDNKRNTYNVRDKVLYPDDTAIEATLSGVDFLSNGFKWRGLQAGLNGSGATYRYFAWADQPIVGSNGTAGVAR